MLRNTQATFERQFMKKLSNTEANLKKGVAHKKVCNSLIIKAVTEMHFLFHCFKSVLAPRIRLHGNVLLGENPF